VPTITLALTHDEATELHLALLTRRHVIERLTDPTDYASKALKRLAEIERQLTPQRLVLYS
jgi:hypothetical protein